MSRTIFHAPSAWRLHTVMYFPLSFVALPPLFGVRVISYVPVSTARSPLTTTSVVVNLTLLGVPWDRSPPNPCEIALLPFITGWPGCMTMASSA